MSLTTVDGNMIESCEVGVYVNSNQVGVTANVITGPSQHGIHVDVSSDGTVAANTIVEPGSATTNTYDGVILSGDSDRNMIVGNKVIPRDAGNTTRYGVNVSAATCDDNVVADNMLIPAANFGTGSYNDAGTGTITTRDGNGQFT